MPDQTSPDPTPQQKISDSLRAVADFYDTHPDFPVCDDLDIWAFVYEGPKVFHKAAADMGTFIKDISGANYTLIKSFGVCHLRLSTARDAVCTRRVIGKKTIPAYHRAEQVVDDVVYDCPEYILIKEPPQ